MAPTQALFKRGKTVAVAIPQDLAERYNLAPGVEVEIGAGDDGILLVPVGVPHWFSFEWERALDGVMERYAEAMAMLRETATADPETPDADADAPDAGAPDPAAK